MMTRSANDIEDVLAYGEAVEKLGGRVVSVTVEGQHKYEGALQPHNTYRVWMMVPAPENLMDAVDKGYKQIRFPNEEEEDD